VDRLWASGKERAATATMEFAILGPLEVRGDGGLVRVPGAKERALLADLVVHAGQVVAAGRLVEDLWGERPPGNPANTLQGRVSGLRRALGPAGAGLLVTRPPGYVLEASPERVDAGRFQGLVAAAQGAAPTDPPRALGLLEAALGLWRGPALVEFADQPWAQVEAARLEELRLGATEALMELRLAAGGQGGLVGELEGLVAAQPLRERLGGLLMVALYRSGRQADALNLYQQTREVLAEELGIDPSPELQRLYHQILVQDPALDAAKGAVAAPPHNLPERLTSLVGREEELRELGKLVEQHRLVTVTGPGGAGKTRVAVELARRLVGGYPDGVWLVELAALRDPALLGEVVAATLGLGGEPAGPGASLPAVAERLASFVADKALLVVLDNCEHLVEACAGLVRRLLEAGPGLRVLATSREVLGVPGEVVWPVPPLAVPAPAEEGAAAGEGPAALVEGAPAATEGARDVEVVAVGPAQPAAADLAPEALVGYDAVRLFVERATAADPSFVLDAASAPVVAELCRRLDGLPLAIELAAARVRALPPPELAIRLQDRFRLLAGGARTAGPRQQTLRATVDWSWDLLAEPDRRLWRRLSVFSGGWTIAAAEVVCAGAGLEQAEVLEGLFRLVDRSLVVAAGGEPARFRLLESLRAYGAERLVEAGEDGAVAARHTAWCLDLAEEAAGHRTARPWLRRVGADYDNLRAALDRAVAAPDPETALRLAGALGWYWWTDRTLEGRQLLTGALALADGQPPTLPLARALQAAAMLEVSLTPSAATTEAARRSLELFERFGDRWGAAFSKLLLAVAELQRTGPSEDGARLVEEAEATFIALGDPWGEAYAGRARFSFEAYHRGLSADAEEAGRRALARFQELEDQWGLAQTHFSLAELAKARGDLDATADSMEHALAAARDGGPLWVELASLAHLAIVVALRGEDARAAALQTEAATMFRRTGQRRGFAHLYNELGGIARVRGDLDRARQLHREALAIVRELVGWSVPHTLAQLACAEARLGDLDAADAHLAEAAGLLLAVPQPGTAASTLVGAALAAIGRDRPEEAARLLAATEAVRERSGFAAVGAERHETDLAAETVRARLDPDALAAAQDAGRAQDTDDLLRELVASAPTRADHRHDGQDQRNRPSP
jgi:predicted ATPase/DNA-binding SARP family transcriptional activator